MLNQHYCSLVPSLVSQAMNLGSIEYVHFVLVLITRSDESATFTCTLTILFAVELIFNGVSREGASSYYERRQTYS